MINKIIELESFFSNWDIPKNKIIIIHSALKPLLKAFDYEKSYLELTNIIIDLFYKYCSPKTLLIPSYSYSFTKSGVYHQHFTKSESGRFSEEVRKNLQFFKTPNPVFSYLDSEGLLKNVKTIDHLDAFNKKSVFGYLHHKDVVLVNMALEIFLATPIHYIEQCFDVEYRYNKLFSGIMYYDEKRYEKIDFKYQVRRLDFDTEWNRIKMKKDLIDNNLMKISNFNGIEFRWLYYDDLFDFYTTKLTENEQYLFQNPYGLLP